MNVKINASGLKDKFFANDIISKGEEIEAKTIAFEELILQNINSIIANK